MSLLVVSYSRIHREGIRGLVQLLRSAYRSVSKAVYWDDDFEPGEPWFKQMEDYIDAAPQLFVFWCGHASTSTQVRREYEYAVARQKRVVPVLLDDTPLPPELTPIHGVDLRGLVLPHRSTSPGAPVQVYQRSGAARDGHALARAHPWSIRVRGSTHFISGLAYVIVLVLELVPYFAIRAVIGEVPFDWRFALVIPAMLVALAYLAELPLARLLHWTERRSSEPSPDDTGDGYVYAPEAPEAAEIVERFRPFLVATIDESVASDDRDAEYRKSTVRH